ncbi:MAG: hypothetical protein IJX71_01775 [Oscillospiraceae bacterium]|nr:hypothetical protein [Oscillospiraceae bacterium]
MLYLSELRDWLRELTSCPCYMGKLDRKQPQSLGVYQRDSRGSADLTPLGGQEGTRVKSVALLLHWNQNADETEREAWSLYEKLKSPREFSLGDAFISYIQLRTAEPVDVGTDDRGVYERVIWLDVYYQNRKDE